MVKKAFLWAKNTELWIVLAQIYTVFLCLFIMKCHIFGSDEWDKAVGVVALCLLLLLVFRYKFYKRIQFWLIFVLFSMTYLEGLIIHLSLLKSVGSSIHRNWYIYLLAMAVGLVSEGKRKKIWVNVLFIVQSTVMAVFFVISIVSATNKLLNPQYEVHKNFGSFVSGRLSTFGSPNTAGPAAAVLILITILLIYRTRDFKYRIVTNILFSLYILIGWIELGLCRSRGSIVAAAAGIGVFFFIVVYDKHKETAVKGFFLGVLVCTVVTIASAAILLVPKPVYDKSAVSYVKATNPEDAERVEEELDCYGITYALDNLTDRTNIWSATIKMLSEKPSRWITGVMPQRVWEVPILDVYEGRPEIPVTTAHNGYLEQLFMYGIPGAAILAVLLIIWVGCAFKAVFSNVVTTKDKIPAVLMVAALINAMVEAFLFPFRTIYPISFFFFMSEGCLEGAAVEKEIRVKKRILSITAILIFLTLAGVLTGYLYKKSLKEYTQIEEVKVKQQNPNDYVRLNDGVSKEMLSPSYWTSLREAKGVDIERERLSFSGISRFNFLNRRMLTDTNTAFSLYEIGDQFYYKVAKSFVSAIMLKPEDPSEYLLNGVPTDYRYWAALERNADVEALNSRITVKFGISVDNSVLKRYPTDDDIYKADSNMYYDELAQSDLLPFMPLAVLHESKDGEWYYVITYGYGGWTRKENVALYDSQEEWLEKTEPEDFLIVTGKELRLPTDPYNGELSGLLLPMGTKLPIVAMKDAPEDIHGRIGYGNYVTKLPIRNEEGMAEDIYVLIPATEDLSLGYLPYTEENVAKLAFKHLGAGYGWAGDNNCQDCSGFVREIYACFGYIMPRATTPQSEIECSESYDVEGQSVEKIKAVLDDAPIGTLLYFRGHIMIYLGNVDGVPYCISSVGNFSAAEQGGVRQKEVNTVIVSDMINTKRADGKSWIESVTKIVVP